VLCLTRINHQPLTVRCSLIEYVDTTPDTVLSLTTGEKMIVMETADEVVARVVEHHRLRLDWKRTLPVRGLTEEN
jgi:flagellar protein FlbD